MHTARLLTVFPSMHCTGGVCSRGCLVWGVSAGGVCVCSGGRELPGWGGGGGILACTEADHPPCEQNSWHTLLKILPCPKLRLRAVNIYESRAMDYLKICHEQRTFLSFIDAYLQSFLYRQFAWLVMSTTINFALLSCQVQENWQISLGNDCQVGPSKFSFLLRKIMKKRFF